MLTAVLNKRLRSFDLDVSLTLDEGILALIGTSGCGKTTVLKMLAGLAVPDRGCVDHDGRILVERSPGRVFVPPEQRAVGYVVQNYALFPHLSVAKNIAYGLPRGDRSARAAKVAEMAEFLDISHLAEALPRSLSGGEQQRVAMARALVTRPRLLLLDEPLSALDASIRGRLRADLRDTLRRLSIPTVVVTHDYEDARVLADRIAVMERGRILQEGRPSEVAVNPASPFVASFVGTNLLPVPGSEKEWVSFEPWRASVTPETRALRETAGTPEGSPGGAESRRLPASSGDTVERPSGSRHQWAGEVVDVAGLGLANRITIEVAPGQRLLADLVDDVPGQGSSVAVGDRVVAYVESDGARLVQGVAVHTAPKGPEDRRVLAGGAGALSRRTRPGGGPGTRRRRVPAAIAAAALSAALVAGAVSLAGGGAPTTSARPVVASVAANLTRVFPALAEGFGRASGDHIKLVANYAGTQILLTQINQGAPSDLFVSADLKHMQMALREGVVRSYVPISRMLPVIIVPKSNPAGVHSLRDLGAKKVQLIIGVPNVPVGEYAREVFRNADKGYGPGFSAEVMHNVVADETNTAQVAQQVATGQAGAGVVYRTDVNPSIASKVTIIQIPPAYNLVATNYAGVVAHSAHAAVAARFLHFIVSPAGQKVMAQYGYKTIG